MRDVIMACAAGESFDRFYTATIKYWRAAAGDLLRRWDHPAAVEEEDLVQEMLLGAWRAIETVDPSRGDPRKYVTFGAVKAARRWFHRQRGAYGFARCSKKNNDPHGRYPVTGLDWFDRDEVPAEVEDVGGLDPREQAIAALESMERAQTERDREVLEAFWSTGCTEFAAAALCRSTGRKRRLAEQTELVREVRGVLDRAAKAANV